MNRDEFFAEHPMFKHAASSVKHTKSDRLKNLIDIRDDYVFVWSEEDGALLAANINSSDQTYQTLRLLSTPSFDVERVTVSAGCGRAVLWGARGVVVAELPARMLASSATPAVLCKSFSLDERFLLSQVEVRRVRWHPDSLAHLLVLVSDNTLRLYNVSMKSLSKLVRSISIGPVPSSRLAGRPILESLGDTAVDFDLAPSGGTLLVLRGNGDVYTVSVAVGDESCHRSSLRGPLAMYPPADDNYGEDSCSLLVVGGAAGAPPLVVIATSSAILYHCLLLPDNNTEDLNKTQEGEASDLALFVLECVELDVVLGAGDCPQDSCPVLLCPMSNKSDRYVCLHAAGAHAVTLPVMELMSEFVAADDDGAASLAARLLARGSSARHAVCTRAAGSAPAAPRGAACAGPALPVLVLLLADGGVVSRTLETGNIEDQLYRSLHETAPDLGLQNISSLLKEREKMSFLTVIQDVLSRSVSQPLLKMAYEEEPSPKEAVELLAQATCRLTEEYIRRQERAQTLLSNKIRDLKTLRQHQVDWFKSIQVQAEDVTAAAVSLRERCAAALRAQENLRDRCCQVIRRLRSEAPATPAERALRTELETLRKETDKHGKTIQQLKQGITSSAELNSLQECKKKEVCLGRSHSDTISSVIKQQSSQLASIIEDTKLLKDQLSIA